MGGKKPNKFHKTNADNSNINELLAHQKVWCARKVHHNLKKIGWVVFVLKKEESLFLNLISGDFFFFQNSLSTYKATFLMKALVHWNTKIISPSLFFKIWIFQNSFLWYKIQLPRLLLINIKSKWLIYKTRTKTTYTAVF